MTALVKWYPRTYEDLEWYTDFKIAQEDPIAFLPDVNDVEVSITRTTSTGMAWIETRWYTTLEKAVAAAAHYAPVDSYIRIISPWESFLLVRTK